MLLKVLYSTPVQGTCGCSNALHKQRSKVGVLRSNVWGTAFRSENTCSQKRNAVQMALSRQAITIYAGPGTLNAKRMNLNEYMITLEKPLGIRFALSINGTVYVHAIRKGQVIKEKNGSVNLVLERPVSPFLIQKFPLRNNPEVTYNRGKVPIVTWDKNMLTSALQPAAGEYGNAGFVLYSSKFLKPRGWKALASFSNDGAHGSLHMNKSMRVMPVQPSDEIVALFTEEESSEGVEWTYGSFPVEEYINALDRSERELCYNHSLGMRYTKVTEHIYVGSCIQTEADVHMLSKNIGITAVLNFQCESERENWGIDSQAINNAFHQDALVVVNCPIREVDSVDLRRKLPFAVGVLYRLLRRNHRVFVTCTTGLDRSPACVIAYLHWIQDVALQEAFDFVTSLHSCGPARPDDHKTTVNVMVEKIMLSLWGEEVQLVGDFKGNWKEPIKAVHVSGPKYAVDLRLPQGKYYYKFIIGGQWRHSTSLPTETDEWGNVNNVIRIGDVASTKFEPPARQQMKEPTTIKVIERPLTEDERFTLAYAARRIAFSICPIRLAPKM